MPLPRTSQISAKYFCINISGIIFLVFILQSTKNWEYLSCCEYVQLTVRSQSGQGSLSITLRQVTIIVTHSDQESGKLGLITILKVKTTLQLP